MRLSKIWRGTAAAAIIGCGVGFSQAGNATVLLTGGQTASGNTITAVNNSSNTTTTITGTNVVVDITQYLGGGAPFTAFLNLMMTSSGVATNIAGTISQQFSGTATFTSLANGGGTNYLSATFTDDVSGAAGGQSLTTSVAQPPDILTFTSSILSSNQLQPPSALSFGFANVTPSVAIIGTTLAGFTSSFAVTASATTVTVPEPGSLLLLGVGLMALGVIRQTAKTSL